MFKPVAAAQENRDEVSEMHHHQEAPPKRRDFDLSRARTRETRDADLTLIYFVMSRNV